MLRSLDGLAAADERVLVGVQAADDAGVFVLGGAALVATVDLITPVCDDPYRFGRVAAANSMSDIFAMGGEILFALNLCCFPEEKAPAPVFTAILQGGLDAVKEAGGVLLGGHSVADSELKYGLAVIGRADPDRILTNSGAKPGQRLILTKPLGSGVILNAFRSAQLDDNGLDPVLESMERLNASAAQLALAHGATGCTDVTGFGIVNHVLEVARASEVGVQINFERIPVYEGFYEMVAIGVSTGGTEKNRQAAREFEDRAGLAKHEVELLFDPQTSGGLLIFVARSRATALVGALRAAGEDAVDIGEVLEGPARVTTV